MVHSTEAASDLSPVDFTESPVLAYRDTSFITEDTGDRLFKLEPLIPLMAEEGERLIQKEGCSLTSEDPVSVCQKGFSEVLVMINSGLTLDLAPERFVTERMAKDLHRTARDTIDVAKADCTTRCIAGLACGECIFANLLLSPEEFVDAVGANDRVMKDESRQYDSTPVMSAFTHVFGFWVLPGGLALSQMPKRSLQLVGRRLSDFVSQRDEFIFAVQRSFDLDG